MIRVLIADDSATTRLALQTLLEGDPDIRVAGTAENGRQALQLAQTLLPDLITMDLQMPLMDGVQAIEEIMSLCPTPIVVVSGCWQTGRAELEMQALEAGALTLVRKPPGLTAPEFDPAARELVETVKAMADVKVVRRRRPGAAAKPAPVPVAQTVALPSTNSAVELITVVTSTGGPPALARLLRELPEDYPIPILVVQHIAPGFVHGLADWLNHSLQVRVQLARHGELPQPGTVYLAPDDAHLGLTRGGRLELHDGPRINGFCPSGDHLFQSAARYSGAKLLSLILTGMGEDGVEGLRAVKAARGTVIAQSEESCVVYGMPRAAVEADLVDKILPLERMAEYLRLLPDL